MTNLFQSIEDQGALVDTPHALLSLACTKPAEMAARFIIERRNFTIENITHAEAVAIIEGIHSICIDTVKVLDFYRAVNLVTVFKNITPSEGLGYRLNFECRPNIHPKKAEQCYVTLDLWDADANEYVRVRSGFIT